MTELERRLCEMDRGECLALLAHHPVGRLAVAAADGCGPIVVPVNYILDGEAIVFRTDSGAKVQALRSGLVSFQVDSIDWYHRTGWSVLARGIAYEATHWEVEHLDLQPWVAGPKRHWIRMVIIQLSGRRIDPVDIELPVGGIGYL